MKLIRKIIIYWINCFLDINLNTNTNRLIPTIMPNKAIPILARDNF